MTRKNIRVDNEREKEKHSESVGVWLVGGLEVGGGRDEEGRVCKGKGRVDTLAWIGAPCKAGAGTALAPKVHRAAHTAACGVRQLTLVLISASYVLIALWLWR